MHAARIEHSPRLKRVAALLADGEEHSTLDIVREARVCAVNSIIAELRANGFRISCRQVHRDGARVWLYRLITTEEVT